MVREIRSFCRICTANCATVVDVDDAGAIHAIRGDRKDPMHRGYACFKGVHAGLSHHSKARVMRPMKRMRNGDYESIGIEQALDEIATRLQLILKEGGPDALGLFIGNGVFFNSAAVPMHYAFMEAVESKSRFTTVTIDVGAKLIAYERLGTWGGGQPVLEQSDVGLVFGANGLVSHQTAGIADVDPARRLNQARARGFKLIVVDPRRTETARRADLFLQPYPGHDAAIASALLRIMITEGWHDAEFCDTHVGAQRMRELAGAVAPFEPHLVEERAGLGAGQLRAAAAMFARDGRRGVAFSMTGLAMGPHSNTAVHMVEVLNVVCGRFLRAGDEILNTNVLLPAAVRRAQVFTPTRSWEKEAPSRIRGIGMLLGERNSGTLADEILTPGKGQVRALIVNGGNPANSVPDQRKIVKALSALELLVTIEPFWSSTARLADYVIPPPLQYERCDISLATYNGIYYPVPWAQYTGAVIERPADSEIIDDWYVYWALCRRLGLSLRFAGEPLNMSTVPTTDELLAKSLSKSCVSLDELKQRVGGAIYKAAEPLYVQPAMADAGALFDVIPADVASELAPLTPERASWNIQSKSPQPYPFLLTVRRMPFIYNSQGASQPELRTRTPYNPVFINPADMSRLDLMKGDLVEIQSSHGRICGVAESDDTMRDGVISLSHGWGGLPDDPSRMQSGVSVNLLISADSDLEELNSMPRMTAIPVSVRRAELSSQGRRGPVGVAEGS